MNETLTIGIPQRHEAITFYQSATRWVNPNKADETGNCYMPADLLTSVQVVHEQQGVEAARVALSTFVTDVLKLVKPSERQISALVDHILARAEEGGA